MKEYLPFIVFASIIALFTIIFIIKGNSLAGEDETSEDKEDSTEENQEQEENQEEENNSK